MTVPEIARPSGGLQRLIGFMLLLERCCSANPPIAVPSCLSVVARARRPIAACPLSAPLTRVSLLVRGAPSGRGEPPASATPASARTTTAGDNCKMSLTPATSRRQEETSSDYVFIALLLTQGGALDGGRDGGSFIRRVLG